MSMGMVNKDTAATIPAAGNTGDKVGNLAALHTTSKSDIVSAVNEVKDEMPEKTDNDAVAPEFNNTTAYSTGELVYKDGQLYKFDSDHAAGALDSSEVSPTTVAAEFNQLKNTLSGLTTILVNDSFDVTGDGNVYKSFLKDLSKDGYELISISFIPGNLDFLVMGRLVTFSNKRQLRGDLYRKDSAAFSSTVTISYGAIYLKKI